jgi:predicted Zn-dependent protease
MQLESPVIAEQQWRPRRWRRIRWVVLSLVVAGALWWLRSPGGLGIPSAVTSADVERAEQEFRRAQQRDADAAELLLTLAENLARRGRVAVAVECVERIPVLDQRSGLRSRLLLAQYCLRLNQAFRAERAVSELLSAVGESGVGDDRGAAAVQVRTARELLVFLLSLQFRFEERQLALRELRQGGLLEPLLTKQLYFPSLLAWRTPQQNERLQQFLKESPQDARLVAAHGRYLLGAGAVEEARQLLDGAVAMSPGNLGVLSAALECRFEEQDQAGFRDLLAVCPEYAEGEPWLLTQMRAEAAALQGDWSGSAVYFEVLLAADDTNALYCQGLARAYGQLGQQDKRLQLQQRALQLAELRLTLGEAELKNPGALRAASQSALALGLTAAAEDLEQLAQAGERALRSGQERQR